MTPETGQSGETPPQGSPETVDWLLDGAVSLVQPASGYRAGLDAVLLAAAVRAGAGDSVLEVGCGAGAVMLCAARRLPDVRFAGNERDTLKLDLARRNIAGNDLADRVAAEPGDAAFRPDAWLNRFDHVVSNPPYFRPGAVKTPHPGKAGAYLADTPLEDWIKFMLHAVRPRGRITLIHRAGALAEILAALDGRFGDIEILPVRPREGAPAKRVLVSARKGLRRGDSLLYAGLVLYDDPALRAGSRRFQDILSGAALEWR